MLKLILDTLDGLDESIKSLYIEKDGKFHLQVDGIEDTSGLKNKVAELLNETKTEREKRVALETAAREAEEARQKEKGEFKTLYEATQSELEKERASIREFKETLQKKEIESEALKLASGLTKDTGRLNLLKKEAREYIKFDEKGAFFEIGGMRVDADKIKAKLSEEYPFLIDGSQASGGGASGGNGGGVTKKFEEYTGAELSEIRKTNPVQYEKLKTEYQNK